MILASEPVVLQKLRVLDRVFHPIGSRAYNEQTWQSDWDYMIDGSAVSKEIDGKKNYWKDAYYIQKELEALGFKHITTDGYSTDGGAYHYRWVGPRHQFDHLTAHYLERDVQVDVLIVHDKSFARRQKIFERLQGDKYLRQALRSNKKAWGEFWSVCKYLDKHPPSKED